MTLADEDVFSNEDSILDDYVAVNVDDDAITNAIEESIDGSLLTATSSTTAFDNLVAGFALNSWVCCAFGYVFAVVLKITSFPMTTPAFSGIQKSNYEKVQLKL